MLLLLLLLLTGCTALDEGERLFTGNILLWHSWPPEDAVVLEQVLAQVSEIRPATTVIPVYVTPEQLPDRYIDATKQGVGPDLLLAPNVLLPLLVESGTVRPVDEPSINRFDFLPAALNALSDDQTLYGFPMAVFPNALFYRADQVTDSPASLDQLVADTEMGHALTLVPRFQPAYWGIGTQGRGLFSGDDRLTLTDSGFAEWLAWLEAHQDDPGIILNRDDTALGQLFLDGTVTYYVAGPRLLGDLSDSAGGARTGVAPLPAGPAGPATPLLPVEAIYLGTASSPEQASLALAVAQFLTNAQQSTTFMRELQRIPANLEVQVDPRVYPVLAGFADQARTAIVLPTDLNRLEFFALGDRAYANVLGGVLSPDAAVCEFGLAVIELQVYPADRVELPVGCAPEEEPDDEE